ncbi:MAG: ATP synthase F1 subunit delta [Alphaproteobacteria bacterium]
MTSSMPISSVVCSRYAGALIDLAEKDKAIEKVRKDMSDIRLMIESSNDLKDVIYSPLVSVAKQEAVVFDISSKARLQKLTKNFLGVLVANRRLSALPGIIKAFEREIAVRSGQVEVRVETASKMSAAQKKSLEKKISTTLKTEIKLTEDVTPEIMGGMVVTIGSYMIDDSVRRKLERLDVALKSNSNQNTVNLKEVV